MHPGKKYHLVSPIDNLKFASHRGFGNFVASGKNGEVLISTAPFYLVNSKCSSVSEALIRSHLSIANPLYKELEAHSSLDCTIIVTGPDGYVSPDWYGLDDQVPTWNYVTVQLKGTIKLLPHKELFNVLSELSSKFEEKLVGTKPNVWRLDKVKPVAMLNMMKAIGPISFEVKSVDGTWKLGQNKSQSARSNVGNAISLLTQHSIKTRLHLALGMDLPAIAGLHMKEINHDLVVEELVKGDIFIENQATVNTCYSLHTKFLYGIIIVLLSITIRMYCEKYTV